MMPHKDMVEDADSLGGLQDTNSSDLRFGAGYASSQGISCWHHRNQHSVAASKYLGPVTLVKPKYVAWMMYA